MSEPVCPNCGAIGCVGRVDVADDLAILVEGGSAVLHPTCSECEEIFTVTLEVVESSEY